jgi:hypothetical protein
MSRNNQFIRCYCTYTESKTIKYITTLFIVLITITGVIASLGLGTAQAVNVSIMLLKLIMATIFIRNGCTCWRYCYLFGTSGLNKAD